MLVSSREGQQCLTFQVAGPHHGQDHPQPIPNFKCHLCLQSKKSALLQPDSYKINPYHLPSSVYPMIKYNGGLFVSLHRNNNPAISKPYPPGTQVLDIHPTSGHTRSGTIMDTPLDPASSPQYLHMWDDDTTRSVLATNMPSLIPKPMVTLSESAHLLPPFLQPGSKIRYEWDGQYHKGFLSQSPNGIYRISYKSHINKASPSQTLQ
jgi:hypothetical protein